MVQAGAVRPRQCSMPRRQAFGLRHHFHMPCGAPRRLQSVVPLEWQSCRLSILQTLQTLIVRGIQQRGNFTAGTGNGEFQGFVDMHVPLGDALCSVAEKRADRQLGKAEITGNATERSRRHSGTVLCVSRGRLWAAA